jgi:4-hydroxyphenylpyruvate dioxygenase
MISPRSRVPGLAIENPMGTDGFEFVEFAHPEPAMLKAVLETMGFAAVAKHRSKNVTLYRQGDVNYVVNAEPESFAQNFARAHGPCVCAMAFRVRDAKHAYERALTLGAKPGPVAIGPMELNIPSIEGIGGSLLYFVDRYGEKGSIWDVDFIWNGESDPHPRGTGLFVIDHLTHNVFRGRMNVWAAWYEKLFNFREIRYFDIEGKLTGLHSRALTSPCDKIRIPINESADDKSQIEEYLQDYKGEGIQHIACACRDIYESVEDLRAKGLAFMPSPPETYYENVETRVPGHGEPLGRMKAGGILIDGEGRNSLLLQIFSSNLLGPVFFEFIQRKGNDGFGEGNFQALFESIEADQLRRGVIAAE